MAEQKKTVKAKEEKKQYKPKPYVHIDTFLQTAVQLYGLTSVEAAGFKAKMQGSHYQTDEKVFLEALKQHLNISQ